MSKAGTQHSDEPSSAEIYPVHPIYVVHAAVVHAGSQLASQPLLQAEGLS